MKMSVTKKIIGTVVLTIVFICTIIGIFGSRIIKDMLVDGVEKQLAVSAYIFKTEYGTVTEEKIQQFKKDNDIDVTIFTGDVRTLSTIDNAIGTSMNSQIWSDIQYGDNYFATDANVNGVPYFGYYIPVMEDGKCIGASFTGVPQEKEIGIIGTIVLQILVRVTVCGLAASVIALVLVRKMVKSIKKLEYTVNSLMDNDLTAEHEKYEKPSDEIESICNKTTDFTEQLKHIVSKIKDTASELATVATVLKSATEATAETSNEITKAVEDVARGAVEQAKDTTEATGKISDMSKELHNIKDNTDDLQNISESMNKAKNNAMNTLSELKKVNSTMTHDVNNTSNQVNVTNESVQKIKEAVDMIQDIASQTHLLSLNASIEASRAGEHGKGFSVVAVEIGKLAEQSKESSTEIEHILADLAKNYELIIENVKNTTANMSVQNEKLSDTQEVFGVLESDINGAVNRIENINVMVNNLAEEIKEMVDMISNLSAISQENSAATQETMASIEELNAVISQVNDRAMVVSDSADVLMNEVNIFKME